MRYIGIQLYNTYYRHMLENLITHFEIYIEIPTQDKQEILDFFEAKSYNKKKNLLDLHSKCKFHYFVIKGCLRMFFIDDKGVEHTIQFAIENWWLTDYLALSNRPTRSLLSKP